MARRKAEWTQLELPTRGRGGRRPGAGRPRKANGHVPHVTRPPHAERHPVHVTIRVRAHVWNLRSRRSARVLRRAFTAARERLGCRLIQFSVQGNHLHLIAEAVDKRALTRAMKGLAVRIARGMNRLMGCRGAVLADRHHRRDLRTPREVRAALAYVLNNTKRHMPGAGRFDPYSSAAYFDGWSLPCELPRSPVRPVVEARIWLLTTGWRRHGLIHPDEVPGAPRMSSGP